MALSRSKSLSIGAAGRGLSLLAIAGIGLYLNHRSEYLLVGTLLLSGLAVPGAVLALISARRFQQLDENVVVFTKPAPFGDQVALIAELVLGPLLGMIALLMSFALFIGAPIYLAVVAFLTFPAHRWIVIIDSAARSLSITRFAPFMQTRVSFDQIERIRVGLALEIYLRGNPQPIALPKPDGVDRESLGAAVQPLEVV